VPTTKRSEDARIHVRFLSAPKVLTRRDIHKIFCLLKTKCPVRSLRPTFVFVSERRMRRLNRRFRGRDRSTDVLAFDLGRPPAESGRGPAAGDHRRCVDIVVCADTARRAARRLGVPVKEELVRYIVHGVLHLTGYDDATSGSRRRMERRQEALVRFVMRRMTMTR